MWTDRAANAIAAGAIRIAAFAGPRAMRILARFNRRVTNPIQRLWAPRLPFMAVIEHTGRKSGTRYRTPVMAFVGDGTISVVLNYGPESDWVRNIRAAGIAGVTHRGGFYRLTEPRVLPGGEVTLPPPFPRSEGSPRHSVLVATLRPAVRPNP
ncbi:nitroreductase family deazaflavin-dependent oxidoreductase [Nocardia sp. NPDC003345]